MDEINFWLMSILIAIIYFNICLRRMKYAEIWICSRCKINTSVLINTRRFVSVPRKLHNSRPLSRVRRATNSWVGSVRKVTIERFISSRWLAEGRREGSKSAEMQIRWLYRLRDQRTTWIRIRPQVCAACKSANVGNIFPLLQFMLFLCIHIYSQTPENRDKKEI